MSNREDKTVTNSTGSNNKQEAPALRKIPIDSETKQLLTELKEGSHEAFQKIFYKWNRSIFGVLVKLLHSTEDAEDVMQDVFIKIWELRDRIDVDKDVKSFIFVVARHTAFKYLEKRKVRVDYLNNIDFNDEDSLNSFDILSAKDIEKQALSIIDKMPKRRKTIYTMSHVEDLNNGQISERLNIPREKVAKELYLARKELKDVLNVLRMIIVILKLF